MKISCACGEKRHSTLKDCDGPFLREEERAELLKNKIEPLFSLSKRLRFRIENDESVRLVVKPHFELTLGTHSTFKIQTITKIPADREEKDAILPNETFEFEIFIVRDKKFDYGTPNCEGQFSITVNPGTDYSEVVLSEKMKEVSHKWCSEKKIKRECKGVINSYYINPDKPALKLEILSKKEVTVLERIALQTLGLMGDAVVNDREVLDLNIPEPLDIPELLEIPKPLDASEPLDIPEPLTHLNPNPPPYIPFYGHNFAEFPTTMLRNDIQEFPAAPQFVAVRNPSFVPSTHIQNPYPQQRTLAGSPRNLSYSNRQPSSINLSQCDTAKVKRLNDIRESIVKMQSKNEVSLDYANKTLSQIDGQINKIYLKAKV